MFIIALCPPNTCQKRKHGRPHPAAGMLGHPAHLHGLYVDAPVTPFKHYEGSGVLPPALHSSCNPRPLISLSILFVSIFQPLQNLSNETPVIYPL